LSGNSKADSSGLALEQTTKAKRGTCWTAISAAAGFAIAGPTAAKSPSIAKKADPAVGKLFRPSPGQRNRRDLEREGRRDVYHSADERQVGVTHYDSRAAPFPSVIPMEAKPLAMARRCAGRSRHWP
jgi:hypothetical protein